MNMILLASVFVLTIVQAFGAEPLKICSFNVQIFGANKAKNENVMKVLGKIFQKYDLCLIQEIRDTKDDSINSLLHAINAKTDNYRMIIGDRLGRSNSKEQYGFFYNKNKINVTDSFHFDDEKHGDLFEREPFVVRFKAPAAAVKDFFIAGIHTNPGNAVQEVGHLVKVYDDAVKRFKINDGVIMGDFNADCGYFAKKNWPSNPLRQDQRFMWLIGDDINTTVGKASCAYDRFVVGGKNLQAHAKGAQTWYYDADYKMSLDEARRVSDHYPIEFRLE